MNKKNLLHYSSLRKLAKYLRPYSLLLALMCFSLLITSSAVLSIGKAIEYLIDHGLSEQNITNINNALLIILIIVLALSFFTFMRFYCITIAGERVVADLRLDIFKKILHMPPSFYDTQKTGDVISRFSADTSVLLGVLTSSFSFVLRNIVMFIGGFCMLIITSPKLTALTSIIIPAVMIPVIFLGRRVRIFSKKSQDKLADLTSLSEESIYAIKAIQSYVREAFQIDQFNIMLKKHMDITLKRVSIRGMFSASIISLVFGGITMVLWYGALQVVNGNITAGELSSFVYLAVVTAASVGAISEAYGELQKAIGALDRIFEFLDTENKIEESILPIPIPRNLQTSLEFKDVTFAYENGKNVFENLSFSITPGKINALVGKSGAGKSTIFSLIEKFYNVQGGSILLNGIDIKTTSTADLRSNITYVPQEPIIFSGTIYENIIYGKLDASMEDVKNAAEQAAALEFIDKLPKGFDTDIGNKGVKLSGGQKQRISIARAILNNPTLLLLDEATSALDSTNEKLVQKALHNLMQNRTTIIIAHRLSTIRNADKIIVIGNKAVLEEGDHKSLMASKGLYKELIELQMTNIK